MQQDGTTTVRISEIFSSVQGEGRWTGHPAVFIRFAGCSAGCWFCDTKQAQECKPELQLQKENLQQYSISQKSDNWCETTVRQVYEYVADLIEQSAEDPAKRIQMVVITGGEPFEQPEALLELCAKLPFLCSAEAGVVPYLRVCIETSGTVPMATTGPYQDGMEEVPVDFIVEKTLQYIYSSGYCFLTVSPKPKPVQTEYVLAANQLKFLVGSKPELDSVIPLEVFKHMAERSEGICFQPIWTDGDDEANKLATQRAIKKAYVLGGTVSVQMHKLLGIR